MSLSEIVTEYASPSDWSACWIASKPSIEELPPLSFYFCPFCPNFYVLFSIDFDNPSFSFFAEGWSFANTFGLICFWTGSELGSTNFTFWLTTADCLRFKSEFRFWSRLLPFKDRFSFYLDSVPSTYLTCISWSGSRLQTSGFFSENFFSNFNLLLWRSPLVSSV